MSDASEFEAPEEVTVEAPRKESITEHRARRAEAKARAAVTVAENAKAAQKAKSKALAKGREANTELRKAAKPIEDRINAKHKAKAEAEAKS